ncbi:MAG: HEAT repeat domain-containing protein [Chloroflexi bacterium]|nr:HEAT repeat domain-containing protein [Chloroflexota bacterium]
MARSSADRLGPLTEAELADGFARLAARQWRVREAKPFARRIASIPSIAAPFLVDRLIKGDRHEREIATHLLGHLQGPRVIAPLRGIVTSQSSPDDVRAAAAAVLHRLDTGNAAPAIRDPERLLADIWETVLQRAHTEESFCEQFIASLEEDEPEARAEMIAELGSTRDARALALLLPLLYSKRAPTVSAAVEAIEALGSPEAARVLEERSKADPTPRIRIRARAAYGRVLMRANPLWAEDRPPVRPEATRLPIDRACVSLIDQNGDQAIIVSRRRADGHLKVFTALVSDVDGIKQCFGVDMMNDTELGEIVDEIVRQGLAPVEVGIGHCSVTLNAALDVTLGQRRRPPIELLVWRTLLEMTDEAATALPETDTSDEVFAELMPQTGALLATPEFRQWYFGAGLVWPYVDEWSQATLEQQRGDEGQRTLAQLVDLACRDLIDADERDRLISRLERQAALLQRMGKIDASRLAAVAARGLDVVECIPLEMHPFVRAMVLSSFLNAGLRPPVRG